MIYKKSLLILLLSQAYFSQSTWFYKFADYVGQESDIILSKGHLEDKYEKMFQDLCHKMQIHDRNIKVRNSGLILRLLTGYHNALACQLNNRVYLNQSVIKELNDDSVKFMMAHELIHHKRHHNLETLKISLLIDLSKKISTNIFNKKGENKDFLISYLTNGSNSFGLSVWGLLKAKFCQEQELQADREAITIGGQSIDSGINLMENLYNPNTTNWPLYAKYSWFISKIYLKIGSLPIIKDHVPHLASKEDRIKELKVIQYK
jgi:Zn-dependent protease with chaperone function